MSEDVTMDEWRAAFEEEQVGDPGSTIREIVEATGLSKARVAERVSKGVVSGKYIAGTGYRPDATGRRQRVAVYRVVKK